jgi:hypothetical protein
MGWKGGQKQASANARALFAKMLVQRPWNGYPTITLATRSVRQIPSMQTLQTTVLFTDVVLPY